MRRVDNWLSGLAQYVEDTEAPRAFWLWGGIFTICAALQRKVWLPYGLENLYPNIYTIIVAPPGKRKGAPVSLAKKMLMDIKVPVSVDSSSKRALTKELAESVKTEQFQYLGKPKPMASLAIISKEMSSLLAVNPKEMIEVLTDLFDSHDEWKYGTAGQGQDFLYNVCVNCFIATTPTWFNKNLPEEAVGGGYTSRHIIITDSTKYKLVPIPPRPDKKLYKKLILDLSHISNLVGPFEWTPASTRFFNDWYKKLPDLIHNAKDERTIGFIERMHIIALKVAMALRVSYSDELIMDVEDLERSTQLLENVLKNLPLALGGYGSSRMGPETYRIMKQIQTLGKVRERELLAMNYRNVTKSELKDILETIVAMGRAKKVFSQELKDFELIWKKGEQEL